MATTVSINLADDSYTEPQNSLKLHSSDNPGLILVSNPLTEFNYLPWRRAMLIALGAKEKIGFIDGSCVMPEEKSKEFLQWKRADCMVISRIPNAISKDIAESFLYATNAKELWDELSDSYGESNGSMLFEVKKEIGNTKQVHGYPDWWPGNKSKESNKFDANVMDSPFDMESSSAPGDWTKMMQNITQLQHDTDRLMKDKTAVEESVNFVNPETFGEFAGPSN